MKNKFIAILVLITILGGVLRLTSLEDNPPSLNWDEVSHGYNAYSILKTGRDEWGAFLPITNLRAYGDYPLPLNLYFTIPGILVFGLNEFGIRFPHVIFGVLSIIATFFLARGLGFGYIIGILASLFVAIDPWTLFPSRGVFQSNLSFFFITAGLACFFNRNLHKAFLPLSLICLGLSLYSYHNARIFVPLLIVAFVVIWKKDLLDYWKKNKTYSIVSLVLLGAFLLPLPVILTTPEARARSNWVFLIDEGAINKIVEQRRSSELPEFLGKALYNKATYFGVSFIKNYLGYFSPEFLFFKGGTNYQFSVPNQGILYPINLLFFYIGLAIVFRFALRKKKEYLSVLFWLGLGLIPAAITQGEYHVIRSTTILPLPQIFTAVGGVAVWEWWKRKTIRQKNLSVVSLITYFVLLALFGFNYLYQYGTTYKRNFSWAWQYGYKEIVAFAKENYNRYDSIIVTKKYGEPHEFFLFYWPWDPAKYRSDPNLIRFYQSNWYWVDRFDKFYFVNDWDVPKIESGIWNLESGEIISIEGRMLLMTSPGNYPGGWRKLETIYFLDGRPVFDILEKDVAKI